MSSFAARAIPDLAKLAVGEPFDAKHILQRWSTFFTFVSKGVFWRRLASRLAKDGAADAAVVEKLLQIEHPHLTSLANLGLLQRLRWDVEPSIATPGRWPTPSLATIGDLARLLETETHRLQRLLDSLQYADRGGARTRHYHYEWIPKRPTGARLIEAPKPRLKTMQRTIHREILHKIPPHPAAHGFVIGRNTASHAAPHVGKPFVVRADLRHFFASIGRGRVVRIFRAAGYSQENAAALAALSTTSTPADVWMDCPSACDLVADDYWRRRYQDWHLPSGAPTSPVLANLAAWRFDRRVTALAQKWCVAYTRYADDLAFSGNEAFRRRVEVFLGGLSAIAEDEGFLIHPRKTHRMPAHRRQTLVGLTVNDRLNVDRRAYETLKAVVHNCATFGPSTQNRGGHPRFREHVLGQIAQIASVNLHRGAKLRRIFDRIDWSR